MRAKTVDIKVKKIPTPRTEIEYTCPKCKTNWRLCDGSIDPKVTTRFLCDCGQEIIAKYINIGLL